MRNEARRKKRRKKGGKLGESGRFAQVLAGERKGGGGQSGINSAVMNPEEPRGRIVCCASNFALSAIQ